MSLITSVIETTGDRSARRYSITNRSRLILRHRQSISRSSNGGLESALRHCPIRDGLLSGDHPLRPSRRCRTTWRIPSREILPSVYASNTPNITSSESRPRFRPCRSSDLACWLNMAAVEPACHIKVRSSIDRTNGPRRHVNVSIMSSGSPIATRNFDTPLPRWFGHACPRFFHALTAERHRGEIRIRIHPSGPGRIRSNPLVPSVRACRVSLGTPSRASFALDTISKQAHSASTRWPHTRTTASRSVARTFCRIFFQAAVAPAFRTPNPNGPYSANSSNRR